MMLTESASPWPYCCYVHFQRIIAASFYLLVCFNAPKGRKTQETFKSHCGRGQGGVEAQRNRGQKGRWKGKEQEVKVLKGKKVGELGEIMR